MSKKTCSDCIHCQMCRWIDDMVKNSTCDFFKDWKELEQIPRGEWIKFTLEGGFLSSHKCSNCGFCGNQLWHFCPSCGADMSANDRQVTGKLNSENEYESKVKELEDAIAKCEQAEKEFKIRTCKFRSPNNCDFCAFHSECDEHWKEGDEDHD